MKFGKFNIKNLIKVAIIISFCLMSGIPNASASPSVDARIMSNSSFNSTTTSESVEIAKLTGCWSCLVFERLTSAFLNVAAHSLPLMQKCGVILLILGTILWLLKWGLDSVSSFSEIKAATILNTLFKMCFKVMLAYWFIILSPKAISQYFIRPIMSVGAIIGQNMWHDEMKDNMEIWEDAFEPDDPEKLDEVTQEVEENNRGDASDETLDIPENSEANTTGVVEAPKVVEPSSSEEIVQDLQKAFIAILSKQLSEIKNSCGNGSMSCGNNCRHKSCSDTGHQSYIKGIMQKAGYGPYVDHYCQASITAAMNKLTDEIGGNITNVIKKAGASCLNGISLGAVGDILLCKEGKQVYQNINIADTVYYHDVQTQSKGSKTVGGGSRHHAVTYIGPNSMISFNGDSQGSLCNSYYYNVTGKVLCISCLFREKLNENPALANGIDKKRLAELANSTGYMSLVNYEGGVFTPSVGVDFSPPTIPDIKYTGPTNIVPESIMNSLLSAMVIISDITSKNIELGRFIMTCSSKKDCGAWSFTIGLSSIVIPNILMWLSGGVIWILGFLLVVAIGFYFIDISFKIGFCVLALPIAVGLWPFKATEDKINTIISTLFRASASFAFMAIITSYGVSLVGESLNYSGDIFKEIESGVLSEKVGTALKEVHILSAVFWTMVVSMFYFYKLVKNGIDKFTGHFFKDNTFGNSNPMHQGAVQAIGRATKVAKTVTGFNLAKDIVTTQLGKKAKNLVGRAGKNIGNKIGNGFNKIVNRNTGG